MMRRLTLPVRVPVPALSLAFALGLGSGCGARGSGEEARGGGSGPVVVRFWNGFSGPDGATMQAIVNRYNAGQSEVQVKMEIIPWGTYYDKVTLGLAFGGAPDLFILQAPRLPEYASRGALAELDGDLASAGLREGLFEPATWGASRWGGKGYALPLDVHPLGLYYNTDLFREAGIARPPETYEEFLADARRLKTMKGTGRDRYQQWGFSFTFLPTNSNTFLNQYGVAMLTPDLQRSALGTPEARAALRRMTDIVYREGLAPKPEGQDAWTGFKIGRVAMAMEGVYMKADLDKQAGLHYAAAPVPRFGPKAAVWAGSHMLVMPRDEPPRRRAAAWSFAKYLSDHSVEWAAGGQIPARRDVQASAAFRAMPVQTAIARQLPYIVYDPQSPSINLVGSFKDSAVEKIVNRLDSEDQAIADADRRIDTVLERER